MAQNAARGLSSTMPVKPSDAILSVLAFLRGAVICLWSFEGVWIWRGKSCILKTSRSSLWKRRWRAVRKDAEGLAFEGYYRSLVRARALGLPRWWLGWREADRFWRGRRRQDFTKPLFTDTDRQTKYGDSLWNWGLKNQRPRDQGAEAYVGSQG